MSSATLMPNRVLMGTATSARLNVSDSCGRGERMCKHYGLLSVRCTLSIMVTGHLLRAATFAKVRIKLLR